MRAAIAAAQDGDTVTLTNLVELAAPVRLDKRITLRSNSADAWGIYILGYFDGEMFQIATNGIVLEWLRLYGSFEMDGLRLVEGGQATLRDCTIQAMRRPIVIGSLSTLNNKLVLERVLVTECQQPFDCPVLEARDCTFSEMAGYGAVTAGEAHFERCTFERNTGNGLQLMYGSVKNCVFRYNGGMGLRYDPDPGVLNISGSLFYANAGAGAYLGEQAIITVDNCTFTVTPAARRSSSIRPIACSFGIARSRTIF